jgi:arylsulfatase A-like enzyme
MISSNVTGKDFRTLRDWGVVTALAALALTALDAILLQERRSFFTGGFLSRDHVSGPGEGLLFVGASLMADAAVVGVLVAVAMTVAARLTLSPAARMTAVLLLAATPLLVMDFVNYRLNEFLGDAFDLGLMFDLTGRRPSEMLAVAASHLVAPALLITGAGTLAGVVVWLLNRARRGPSPPGRPADKAVVTVGLALLAIAILATAALRAASDVIENGLRRKPAGQVLGSIAWFLSDVDRDGYGWGARLADPDPFDANVFPYATDLPGNGVDENGLAGDLPADTPPYVERADPVTWRQRPDVVLIVLESFRADALDRAVGGRPVTPVLHGLAARGVSSRLAFSHNGYTSQSRYHLLSGSLAGVRDGRTLVDDFKANGYEVAYFSGQDESFADAEFDVGFDRADHAYDARQDKDLRYSTFSTAGSLAVPYTRVLERLRDYLRVSTREKPLFLYVNLHDTHYPYHHAGLEPIVSTTVLNESLIAPARAAELQEMYYNSAANVDRAIGVLLEDVTRHLGGAPAVIVTADHGESLFDEGFLGHGYAINDVQTRIPLVVTGLPMLVEEPFGQVDLRDAIGAALAEPDGGSPQLRRVAGKAIVQYLGNLHRPRQFGLATAGSRTIYDFRTDRLLIGDAAPRRPSDLQGDDREEFVRVVHLWERMMLARRMAARAN